MSKLQVLGFNLVLGKDRLEKGSKVAPAVKYYKGRQRLKTVSKNVCQIFIATFHGKRKCFDKKIICAK